MGRRRRMWQSKAAHLMAAGKERDERGEMGEREDGWHRERERERRERRERRDRKRQTGSPWGYFISTKL
jgi:hypothetical protein